MYRNNTFYIILFSFLLLIFSACDDSSSMSLPDEKEDNSPVTEVRFTNIEQFPVTVYVDPFRQTVSAHVAKLGSETVTATPNRMGMAFYPTFHLDVFEITGVNISYNGPAFVASIQPNVINRVSIPKLEQIEINNSYIKIINNSDFPLSLRQGSSEKRQINNTSTILLPKRSTAYELTPGNSSSYTVMRNTTIPIDFPSELDELKPGIVYVLTYNGAYLELTKIISLIQTIPPEIPTDLNLTILSNTNAEITWDTVYGAMSYNIYRTSGSITNTYNKIATTNFPIYRINELTHGQVYYYKITSLSGLLSESGYSSEVFIITPPVNINATSSTTNIKLEWNAYTGVNSFNIYRSNSENDNYVLININKVTGTTYTDTSVALETKYYYKISAKNTDIEGLLSNALSAETLSTIPTNVHVTGRSTININLSWDNIIGTSGYKVYRATTENGAFTLLNSSLLTSASYNDSNVIPGTMYYYKVSSVNNNIESILSNTILTNTLSPIPTNVRCIENNISRITIAWNIVSEASYYNIYRSTSENGVFLKLNTSSINSAEYNDINVSPYTTYFYKVTAVISSIERAQSVFTTANTGLIVNGYNLLDKLNWLKKNATSNNFYSIVLDKDEYIGANNLSYGGSSGITINIIGDDTMRNIYFLSQGSLFTISSGVTVILENNVTLHGSPTNNKALITIDRNGSLIMNENTSIVGNINNAYNGGGGVYCYGNFTMNGGKISNNSTMNFDSSGGGGVFVIGIFVMNGGEISDNFSARDGGGISIDNGTFTMNDGIISGNNANNGGGIYITASFAGTSTMNGGAISGNVSNSNGAFGGGGGVYISNGNFTLNGGKISNNVSNSLGFFGGGAGVFVRSSDFIMKGGEISGNTHTGSGLLNGGGGIMYDNGDSYRWSSFRMSGGVIYGRNAATELRTSDSLYYYDGYDKRRSARYGVFNGDSFSMRGYLTDSVDTIRVVNGSLLNY